MLNDCWSVILCTLFSCRIILISVAWGEKLRPPGLVASTGPLVNTVFHVGGGAVFHLELGFQNVE